VHGFHVSAWNTEFRPLFYRDIWPILYRPDQFRFLCDILAQSNFPHDQEQRGLFDPAKLSVVPGSPKASEIAAAQTQAGAPSVTRKIEFTNLSRFTPTGLATVQAEEDRHHPYEAPRLYLFGLLRMPGEENEFKIEDKVSSRLHNLPLMPLLCGDNPLTNTAPSKFLRLTDYMLIILKQWADVRFINEIDEGWLKNPPYTPYLPYPSTPRKQDASSTVACSATCLAAHPARAAKRLGSCAIHQSTGSPTASKPTAPCPISSRLRRSRILGPESRLTTHSTSRTH
jgi:hypothetical protein